jgi:hypothetical protein
MSFAGSATGARGFLRETQRAVTPFGGLVVLVEWLQRLGLLAAVRERLPFTYTSNNASQPEHILLAFRLAVVAGARRFVVVRLQSPAPAEPRLLAVPGYELRVFVTNRTEPPE